MRIQKDDVIALVIDFQEKLVPAIHEKETILQNSALLIRGLKTLNIPLVVTQQYTKGLGDTVEEITTATGKVEAMDKRTFSAYENDAIRRKIETSGRETILLCGTEAHVCVLQTLIDLREADYQVVLITDCIGSRRMKDKEAAIQRAIFEGAIVTSYEQILFELTRKGDTPLFKEMLQIIK